ncbi:hypothetical protein LVD15_15980 [Fulvivirga maritima]|uniref:hypothetical protein n=1 Tax=Fulvivirga maritima TaxID=2904247 RepID=UPI001F39C3D9|nr:hypothetical protein [Fulvivirga maritima]UII24807.1 hypothetical protein LVD15_15980 [Fulvivirga maritima]
MIKIYHLIIGIFLFCCIQACTQRSICPAYQSAFIHDEEALRRHFSYFAEDSTPKVLEANKDRFLIIEPMSYKKKIRSMQTVAMEDVYPQEEDSLEFDDEFYLAEREGYDSTAVISVDTLALSPLDSAYKISIKEETFNTEQELYLWYLKDYLVYPDTRLQMESDAEANGEGKKKEGFFKRLFGKKKNKSDSTQFDVETSATELDGKKKKKGFLGGLFKKKKKGEATEEDLLKEEEEEPDLEPDLDINQDDF